VVPRVLRCCGAVTPTGRRSLERGAAPRPRHRSPRSEARPRCSKSDLIWIKLRQLASGMPPCLRSETRAVTWKSLLRCSHCQHPVKRERRTENTDSRREHSMGILSRGRIPSSITLGLSVRGLSGRCWRRPFSTVLRVSSPGAAYLRLVASTAFPSSTGFAGTTGVPPKLSRSVANRCASAVSACRRSRLF